MFESLHSWSISYGGWDFIPNLGGRVAEAGFPLSGKSGNFIFDWNVRECQGILLLVREFFLHSNAVCTVVHLL